MPERTCVSCRKKGEKEDFFRISEKEGNYVFDKEMKIQSRGFYVCKSPSCIEKLSKNRKYNIEMQELLKLLKETEKKRKNIIDIIRPMKNSGFFVFGIDENIEGIKKNKVRLLILPKDINEKYAEQFKRLEEKFEVIIVNIEKKEEFLNVFSRNVNVVGITDKRVVNGILSKVEVTE
jgi:hypothetical protein